jgi:hypothetical protein
MKTKEIIRIVGFSLIIVVVGILLTGCATGWQAYNGSALPLNHVAVLKCPQGFSQAVRGNGVYVIAVDGISTTLNWDGSRKRNPYAPASIELLAGHHTIMFLPGIGQNETGDPITKEIDVEAGKVYKAEMTAQFNSSFGNTRKGHWWVEITEEK